MSDAGLTIKALSLVAILVLLLAHGRKHPWFLPELIPHIGHALVYVIANCVLLIVLALGIEELFSLDLERSFVASLGVVAALQALLRIDFFWEHDKVRWVRRKLGDRGAVALYVGLGGLLVAWAGFTS